MSACSAELGMGELEQAGLCAPWQCSNSEEVMHYRMHEANLFGKSDAQGISLRTVNGRAQIYDALGKPYDLYVEKNRFVGVGKSGRMKGIELIGAELEVLLDGEPLYNITIRAVREIPFPVGAAEPVEVYRLTRHEPGTPLFDSFPACNTPDIPLVKGDPELHGMDPDETLIFAGDRIDPTRMTMSEGGDFEWFNFGCAGHTLAKLHLTRNTITSQQHPSWRGRQATLKLMVGDYCGKGKPITVAGTPLRWQGGLVKYAPTPDKLEARWDEHGATCVNVMRLEANPSLVIPEPRMMLKATCYMPACDNLDVDDFDGAQRITATPL